MGLAVPSMQKPQDLPSLGPPSIPYEDGSCFFFKPWTSQSSVLILDDWTCLPANALQAHLIPPQLLPHFIFSKKKQMFLSASDFEYKRCSIFPEQDFSDSSAVPNLKLSTKWGPSVGNSCSDRLTELTWKPHTPTLVG